ncbi:MAG: hypothetical protein KatS3mg121_0710 [Gammaproteobacteria bacterium]|nr:MAG: hypothetical protein KatS3mg121_0710 [Gammaproteobacteria bacterium]
MSHAKSQRANACRLLTACVAAALALAAQSAAAYQCPGNKVAFEHWEDKSGDWNAFLQNQAGGNIQTWSNTFKNQHCPQLKQPYSGKFYGPVNCDFFPPQAQGGAYQAGPGNPARFRISGCKVEIKKGPALERKLKGPTPGPDVGPSPSGTSAD